VTGACGFMKRKVKVFAGSLNSSASGATAAGALATISLTNGGLGTHKDGTAAAVTDFTWLLLGAAASYSVMFTHSSGTAPTGTTGSWLNLGTTRSLTLNGVIGVPVVSAGTYQIREDATGTVLDSAPWSLESDRV
jgi:hypothetical protein